MSGAPVYDGIGSTYASTRQADPRVAAQVQRALAGMRTVVDVGAGSYEMPATVLAVEPSATMLRQRRPGLSPAVQARAEALPLADDAVDAATLVLTVHHWTDLEAGLAEVLRVVRRRVVLLTWEQAVTREFWLLREYLPEAVAIDDARAVPVARLAQLLGGARVEVVPVPHDCRDGFGAAFWRRPQAYLDPTVRAGMSMLAQTGEAALAPGLARLAEDVDSGRWAHEHADLLALSEYDAGYRLLVADLA